MVIGGKKNQAIPYPTDAKPLDTLDSGARLIPRDSFYKEISGKFIFDDERNEMEYSIMLRTVGTAEVSGARTADSLKAEVDAKLAEGWKLLDVQFVGTTAEGYIFAYHFVK
jgi:hypothetical protein